MSNLNLYNRSDKSLAETNRDYHKATKNNEEKTYYKGKNKKLTLIIVLFLMIISFGGIYFYNYFSNTELEVIHIKIPIETNLHPSEEKQAYIEVQLFEITEKASNKQNSINNAIEENPPIDVDESDASSMKKLNKNYSIIFENIISTEYDAVNMLALKYNLTPEIKSSTTSPKIVWRVYRINPASTTVIGNKNVEKVKDFENKNDAITFAKKYNIQSLIRLEEDVNAVYTLKLCCMTLSSAKNFAVESNIYDRPIKIVREK